MGIIEEIQTKDGVVRLIESYQGPVAADRFVVASGDDWVIRRWYFFQKFNTKEAKRFGVRLINNSNYRQKCLNEDEPWILIQNLYLEAEQNIVSTFEERSLFEHSHSNFEGEMRAKWAEHKLMKLLKEVYDSISFLVLEFSVSPTLLKPYLEKQYEAARGIAAMIDADSNVGKEDVRPSDRLLECRSPTTREWIVEDNRVEIPTVIDAYAGEYQPIVALRVPAKKKEAIKDLDWYRTHRRWNTERELWTVDLDSLEYVIQELVSRNHIVRIAEPVVRLAGVESPDRPEAIRPNWSIPTVQPNGYEKNPSATDLLLLPGIGAYRARGLLKEGFGSIPEVAHSSISQLAEAEGIGEVLGEIAKHGALVAIGRREPPSVQLARETPLSLPDACREVASLAARGVPQSDSLPTLIELYQTHLSDLDSIFGTELYSIYKEGYQSLSDLAEIEPAKLEQLEYITQEQAEEIIKEANNTN